MFPLSSIDENERIWKGCLTYQWDTYVDNIVYYIILLEL